MLQTVVAGMIIVLCYVCIGIIVFAPTIYAVWFYVVSRKVSTYRGKLLKTAMSTFAVNAVAAYLLFYLAIDLFLVPNLAAKDEAARRTVEQAIQLQEKHFAAHGKYNPVGPVRGPYEDDSGLIVPKDVIIEIAPAWDKHAGRDTFRAHAVHVWGEKAVLRRGDGAVVEAPAGSTEAEAIRGKLIRSVK
jgi:hypothetical protein